MGELFRFVRPIAVIVIVLVVLAPIRASRAEPSPDLPAPSAFALPRSAFPSGAGVRGGRAQEKVLEADSGLHTTPLADLGHLLGYRQQITWVPARAGTREQPVSLSYLASIFSSADGADRAFADAQASLWELGAPLALKVATSRVFSVSERDGSGDDYVLLYRGSIELELRLRYARNVDQASLSAALGVLRRAGALAWTRAGHLAAALPAWPAPATGQPFPDVAPAPWGTGPVIKSPSLMVLDPSQFGADTHLDLGAARSSDRRPPLAAQAVLHPAIVPSAGLSRYTVTASTDAGGGWYDSAALYPDPAAAWTALTALFHANRGHAWLPPYALDPAIWHAGSLSVIDDARAWRMHGETILALRVQNVVMILAAVGPKPDAIAPAVEQVVRSVPSWLHAQGTSIVTAAGDPIRLASVNWYGAEEKDFVVGGLDFQTYEAILRRIKLLGFNSIRLPLSNQLVEQNPVVTGHIAANPDLQGLHALDIVDRIVNYAGALGLSIILDDHRSDAGWGTQADGLWYTKDYPESSFNRDWQTLAQRFVTTDAVIGADLRNEPHAKVSWGDGNALTDWHAAAQRAGDAVLSANSHLLVMIEGIQFYKDAPSYWWGGSLMGVRDFPIDLRFADGTSAHSQLVYSVHDYGPDLCATGCPWFNKTTTYASLSQIWDQYWGYIVDDPTQPYAAPIWVGEFGTCDYQPSCVSDTTSGSQGEWFSSLVQYIAQKHLSWGYWAVNGTESTGGARLYGTLDWYGFLDHTWTAPYPWLEEGLHAILSSALTGSAPGGRTGQSLPPGTRPPSRP